MTKGAKCVFLAQRSLLSRDRTIKNASTIVRPELKACDLVRYIHFPFLSCSACTFDGYEYTILRHFDLVGHGRDSVKSVLSMIL